MVRLYVNVDHVATLRQQRDTGRPDPVLAAGAQALGHPAINALDDGDLERQCYHSQWIMIPAVPGGAMDASLAELGKPLAPKPGFRPWTDDRWSLYPVLQTGLE